jgi:hypothetical protein
MTLARISLASETVKRVRLFFLLIESISIRAGEFNDMSKRLVASSKNESRMRTLRYSLVASCHSLVIDLGGGRAKE